MERREATHVIVDTDAGVDDAVAIIMALHGFKRDAMLGITTVFGNVDLHQANHNIQHILEAVGRTDVPIHSGAQRPIVSSISEERWGGHGPDGLGGQSGTVQESMKTARRNDAVHFLLEKAHKHRGELTIIALGPLTNVALAALLDPTFLPSVKHVVIMGGTAEGQGNLSPHSEFNVGCDPEATDLVLQHCRADQLYVMPIETCVRGSLPWAVFDEIFDEANCKYGGYIRRIWQHTKSFVPHMGFTPCDAYAVALLLHDKVILEAQHLHGRVHLAHDERRGASVWDKASAERDALKAEQKKANATLVTKIDKDIFTDLLRCLVGHE